MNTTQSFPSVAKFAHRRYGAPVAANSATRVWSLENAKGAQASYPKADAFFMSAISCYGGCVWDAFGRAGFLLPRLTNLHTVRLHSFGHEGGDSLAKGALPMQFSRTQDPSATSGKAAAHRAMAIAALHADSSLSVRLKRYNAHMSIARTLETVGSAL